MTQVVRTKTIRAHASYLDTALFKTAALLKRIRTDLKGVKFDTIVGRGVSGALVCPPLARMMRKNVMIVRKDNDTSHSSSMVEGALGGRWLFVDDLIDSGDTLREAHRRVTALAEVRGHDTTCVGAYLYRNVLDQEPGTEPYEWGGFLSYEELKNRRHITLAAATP